VKKLFLAVLLLSAASSQAAPTAWGQPMPEQCTTTFEWKSPSSYPVHVYKDPTCLKPWAENAVTFWKGLAAWIKEKGDGRTQ
jgi:hypothetical protein